MEVLVVDVEAPLVNKCVCVAVLFINVGPDVAGLVDSAAVISIGGFFGKGLSKIFFLIFDSDCVVAVVVNGFLDEGGDMVFLVPILDADNDGFVAAAVVVLVVLEGGIGFLLLLPTLVPESDGFFVASLLVAVVVGLLADVAVMIGLVFVEVATFRPDTIPDSFGLDDKIAELVKGFLVIGGLTAVCFPLSAPESEGLLESSDLIVET